jgi:hypothetical protein
MFIGQPNDLQWDDVSSGVAKDVCLAEEACSFISKQVEHQEGPCYAFVEGVSFDGDHQVNTCTLEYQD